MIRRFASLAVVLLLPACAAIEDSHGYVAVKEPYNQVAPAWLTLEVVSLTTTHKTMFDHVATWVTGRDCSTPRSDREDGPYCVDWPKAPPPPQQEYCYASLARPTCFAQPYNEGNDHLIGFVPAAPPIR